MTVPQDKIRAERHYWIVVKGPCAGEAHDTLEIALPYFDENGAVTSWDGCGRQLRPDEIRRVVQAVPDPTEACRMRCFGPMRTRYPGGDPENGPARRECLSERCQAEQDMEEMARESEDVDEWLREAHEDSLRIADQMIHHVPALARIRESLAHDIMNQKWHHVAHAIANIGSQRA